MRLADASQLVQEMFQTPSTDLQALPPTRKELRVASDHRDNLND